MSNVKEVVLKLAAKNFKVPIETIKMESRFEEDLSADSLDIVEMFIDIEDELNIDINIEELQGKVTTIGEAIAALEKLVN